MSRAFRTTAALLVLSALSVLVADFSVHAANYPPPTNLTAEAQSLGSGQIRLSWQKPSSSDVIGYNIYRNGAYLTYLIGGGSLSYYDSNLPASTVFDYYVKAVYVGVSEGNLPASNTVSALSPAYCTGGASRCVGLNPFISGTGRTIVDLKGKKLDATHKTSETFSINLPAGRYQVHVRTFDAYRNRKNARQENERWRLVLLSSGREIMKTNVASDLPDGVDEVGETQVIQTELILPTAVHQIKAEHAGVSNGGSFDDVGVSAVMFASMSASGCQFVATKSANKTRVVAGDEVTYTITATNKGTQNCTGGGNYVYDKMPAQLSFVRETHTDNTTTYVYDGGYNPSTHAVFWVVVTPLVPNETATMTLTGKVKSSITGSACDGDQIENRVFVTNYEYSDRSVLVYSNTNSITCSPALAPPTITATPRLGGPGGGGDCDASIDLSWTSVTGATEYRLYRTDNSSTPLYRGGSTRFNDSAIENNITYSYYVIASNSAGDSPRSNSASGRALCQLSVLCQASPTRAYVNENIVWDADIFGGIPPFQYLFSGTDGLNASGQSSGRSFSSTKSYTTAGVKRANLDVTSSDGQSVSDYACKGEAGTEDVIISERTIDSLTCSGSPRIVKIGERVTWRATPSPSGNYTYVWSGSENLSGSSQTVTKVYTASGAKTARVSVSGVANSPKCVASITVQGTPTYQEI